VDGRPRGADYGTNPRQPAYRSSGARSLDDERLAGGRAARSIPVHRQPEPAMKTALRTTLLSVLLCLPAAHAQDATSADPEMSPEVQAMMAAWEKAMTPGEQHARLAGHFEGTWDTTMRMWMEPGAEPTVSTGISTNTMVLGGRQLKMEFSGTFMDMPFMGIGFTGYDNVTGKYTGTWTDNMSTGTMHSTGSYDPASSTYTFTSEMPDPMHGGAIVPVRETIRIVDADHHVMEMFETREGVEVRTMELEYRRRN
jgi:hypothetical protein